MKICVIGTRGFPNVEGGVENHCQNLYALLSQENEIIVYRRKPYITNFNNSYKNISFIDLPSTKIKGFETVFHSFISTINAMKRKPDIIHYHNIGPAMFSFLINKKITKIVLTYHSANYEHNKWGKIAKKILRLSEKIAIKYADKIIVVNSKLIEMFPKYIQKKCIYIPNGISQPVYTNKRNIIDKYKLISNEYILTVGRLVEEKGIDILIKAFIKANLNKYKLAIVGKINYNDPYYKKLYKLKNNNVIFLDYLNGEDLFQVYQNAKLFVLSSRNESFPIALLEAMSYKKDVLVNKIENLQQISVLDDDDYFKTNDIDDLCCKIKEKLNSTNNYSRLYNLNEYDWNKISRKTNEVYNSSI